MRINKFALVLFFSVTFTSIRFESFAFDENSLIKNFDWKSETLNPEIEEVIEANFAIASNISVTAGGSLVVTSNISLPSNASIVGTYLTLSGVTVSAGTWPSDVSISMSGVSSLSSQPVANINGQMIGGGPFSYQCASIESSGGGSCFDIFT